MRSYSLKHLQVSSCEPFGLSAQQEQQTLFSQEILVFHMPI